MADYQFVSSRGVVVPDTATLRSQVEAEWREAFGQDIDLSPDTPQGVMVTAEVEARDAVARNNAEVANQINPDIASGIWLDAIWRLTRGSRRAATRSTIAGVVLGGQPGTIVPAGSLAAVESSNDLFRTTGVVTIGPQGTATVAMESVETGPIAAPANQLRTIATSVLGWETVTNPNAAQLGRLEESDIASRRRRRSTLALQGVALPEAITSRVYAIEGVKSLVFRENISPSIQTIDGIIMAPKSVYLCVDGGQDAEVAQALLETKSLGAAWNGGTVVGVTEPASGQTYFVQFDRPQVVQLYARVFARFGALDGETIVRDAIAAYADGELEGEVGFAVGEDVSPFELAGAVNQFEPRIFVTRVELSTDGITFSVADVPIALNQVAALPTGSITVIAA